MHHLRSAFKVLCLLGNSLVCQGCFAGGLAALYLGEIWAVNTTADAIRNASKESSPRSPGAGFVIYSLSDPPSRATAGASFAVRDAVFQSVTARAAPPAIRYYLSLATNFPLRADKLLLGSRLAVSEGTATVTIPDDTLPGTYRLAACPRELRPADDPHDAVGCAVSSGTLIVEPIGSAPAAAGAVQRPAPVHE